MDSAADSLLALSNTAVALADTSDIEPDDDRSSSLSELDEDGADEFDHEQEDQEEHHEDDHEDDHEDEHDDEHDDEHEDEHEHEHEQLASDAVVAPEPHDADADADSEAETERLEESPDKRLRKRPYGSATPSKLAQTIHAEERPEIESLTESTISSPISSNSDLDELSDAPVHEDESGEDEDGARLRSKRKRDDGEEPDAEEQARARRRRTGSVASEDEDHEDDEDHDDHDDGDDDAEERASDEEEHGAQTREGTVEPEAPQEQEAVEEEEVDEDEDEEGKASTHAHVPERAHKLARSRSSRSRRRDKTEPVVDAVDHEPEEGAGAGDDSDEAEAEAEVDDAEVAAKSEEEHVNKIAAMESLQGLERHFAALRDRLYDERIAAINHELDQLAEPVPVHAELLKQLEIVKRWRDQKFEIEQKLLVYKIGALKNKSLAERSQIHSAYFQTVRDLREKHLERLSEHFYRIQRDRFRAESAIPSFTIPFPEKRSKQISQQTAYNKEVSILSGIAKYVGFPAAPEIASAHASELEADLQKLGLSAQVKNNRPLPRPAATYSSGLGTVAADEHFLERNPWANPPQHPIHRLALSRQHSNQSPLNESYLTPVHQRTVDQPHTGGSASTIPEHPSQPASSAHNTPLDHTGSHQNLEAHAGINRLNSPSPLDTRHAYPTPAATATTTTTAAATDNNSHYYPTRHYDLPAQDQDSRRGGAGEIGGAGGAGGGPDLPSSPLAARIAMVTSPSRPGHALADGLAGHSNSSTSQRPPSIAAGGYGGVARMGIF